jgi:hypothetical protein
MRFAFADPDAAGALVQFFAHAGVVALVEDRRTVHVSPAASGLAPDELLFVVRAWSLHRKAPFIDDELAPPADRAEPPPERSAPLVLVRD